MSDIHLVKMIVDAQRLYTFARHARLPTRDLDEGYAVHGLLMALFDHGASPEDRVAPKPFAIPLELNRRFDVWGYARLDSAALVERAKHFGDPAAWGAVDLASIVSKPMPQQFAKGTKLGFSVRTCPVRRVKKRGNQQKDRAEVDVFLAKVWEVDDPSVAIDREETYREWLAVELEKAGARLVEATLTSFQLGRQHRRTQSEKRAGARTSHPEASFEGVLEVTEPALFSDGLARGLGRHRAFGFGMMLLKPAPRG